MMSKLTRSRNELGLIVCMFATISVVASARLLHAGSPDVMLDVPRSISCKSVSAGSTTASKIIEVVFGPSAQVKSADASEIAEITVEITEPSESLRVRQLPTNSLPSVSTGRVVTERVTEKDSTGNKANGTIQGEVSGGASIPGMGGVGGRAEGQASAGSSHAKELERQMSETTKMAPPAPLVAGELNQGYGLWAKLRPSAERQLEGKLVDLVCRFEVIQNWRCDYVQFDWKVVDRHSTVRGTGRFLVGLFIDGDEQAKTAVESIAHKQQIVGGIEQEVRRLNDKIAAAPNDATINDLEHKIESKRAAIEEARRPVWLDSSGMFRRQGEERAKQLNCEIEGLQTFISLIREAEQAKEAVIPKKRELERAVQEFEAAKTEVTRLNLRPPEKPKQPR